MVSHSEIPEPVHEHLRGLLQLQPPQRLPLAHAERLAQVGDGAADLGRVEGRAERRRGVRAGRRGRDDDTGGEAGRGDGGENEPGSSAH